MWVALGVTSGGGLEQGARHVCVRALTVYKLATQQVALARCERCGDARRFVPRAGRNPDFWVCIEYTPA